MTNQAIAILMEEHQLILKGLDAAAALADRLEKSGGVPASDIERVFDFITRYADEFHHKKEEDVLFKWMEEKGFPVSGGPIAMMLFEHDSGRDMVAHAKTAFENFKTGDTGAAAEVAAYLRGFAEHLRQHIFKEDNILYPMALRLFESGGEDEVMRRYRAKIPAESAERTNRAFAELVSGLRETYAR